MLRRRYLTNWLKIITLKIHQTTCLWTNSGISIKAQISLVLVLIKELFANESNLITFLAIFCWVVALIVISKVYNLWRSLFNQWWSCAQFFFAWSYFKILVWTDSWLQKLDSLLYILLVFRIVIKLSKLFCIIHAVYWNSWNYFLINQAILLLEFYYWRGWCSRRRWGRRLRNWVSTSERLLERITNSLNNLSGCSYGWLDRIWCHRHCRLLFPWITCSW